ncbi:MAG: peptidoglycan-associated lipoprotein Pal [Rhodoferax sp.]
MQRYLPVLFLSALLVGCGSSVKLDDVAVEDRSATPVAGQAGAGTAAGTGAAGSGTSAQASGNAVTSTPIAPVTVGNAAGAAAPPPAGARTVYFDYDSFAIKPEFVPVIEAQARYLKADPKRHAAVEGHTDERGGREYNLALGQKRAEAVRRALGLLGVADAQVEAVSFGKEKPAVSGSDEAAMAKNRRAEINYR